MEYRYEKYEVVRTWPETESQLDSGSFGYMYTDRYKLRDRPIWNKNLNRYVAQNSSEINVGNSGSVGYNMFDQNDLELRAFNREYNDGRVSSSGHSIINYITYGRKVVKTIGNFIESKEAEDESYPINGVHTDGYWYIKKECLGPVDTNIYINSNGAKKIKSIWINNNGAKKLKQVWININGTAKPMIGSKEIVLVTGGVLQVSAEPYSNEYTKTEECNYPDLKLSGMYLRCDGDYGNEKDDDGYRYKYNRPAGIKINIDITEYKDLIFVQSSIINQGTVLEVLWNDKLIFKDQNYSYETYAKPIQNVDISKCTGSGVLAIRVKADEYYSSVHPTMYLRRVILS